MKCLHTNDWHCWHLTPSSRLDSWPAALANKLDQIAEIAELKKVDAICVAGDLFHSVHTSFEVVNRLIAWGKARAVPVLAIPGNHDERYNRLDSLPTTPIGALFASGAFVDVSFRPTLITSGASNLGFVVGIPWPDAKQLASWSGAAKLMDPRADGCAIVLGHAFASKAGGQFFGQTVLSYAALSALPFDVFHFGHDHSAKATQKLNGKLFLNFGALGRGSLAAEELERDILVAISEVTSTGVEGEFVKLRVAPAATIFDLRRYAFEKQIAREFESGLGQRISADFLAMAETTSLVDRVTLLDVDEAVRESMRHYLTQAEEAVA